MRERGKMTALPIALFIFSGSMLTLGRGGTAYGGQLVLAFILASLALPASCVAAEGVFGQKEKRGIARVIFIVFAFISCLAAIYSASLMTVEFSLFASKVMLLRIPSLIVSIIFIAFSSYLACHGVAVIKKFALVSALIVLVSSLLLFALSAPNFDWGRIRELIDGMQNIDVPAALSLFSKSFASGVIAVIYFASNGGVRGRSAFFGTAFSLLLILICFLGVLLLLGGSFGATLEYPYATAVSTVTAGKLFARLEGFAYLTYYVSSALRVSVCISLVSTLVSKKSRILPYAVGALVLLVTVLLSIA